MTSLPSRRKKTTPFPLTAAAEMTTKKRSSSLDVENSTSTPKTTAKKSTPSVDVVEQPSSLTAKKSTAIAEKSSSLQTKKSMKKQMHSVTSAQELGVEETPQSTMRTKPKESQECSQLDIRAFLEWEPELESGQLKSMSSVAVNTPEEVMVDCYARREDHRMKGHSSKGMSCTDKNTMVFVVMEGEVSVTIHTTQFNAKKGDSFYVPPKNSYNLINEKAIEAELSLIQFQYDGPLPTAARVHS